MLANIHETEKPRWKAAIDVTLRSTLTLAAECHTAVERNQLKVEYLDAELQCNGPVAFTGTLATGEKLSEPYVSWPEIAASDAHEKL